jgi:uncharacterized protein
MRVHVDEIPESGRFLHFHWGEDRLQHFLAPDDPLTIHFGQPLLVDLEIHRLPDHIRVQGSIQADFLLVCHRCLETYPWQLEQPVDLFMLEQRKDQNQAEEDLAPDDDDLECEFFNGQEIDIDLLVAEQVFLAMPVKAICSEECRGLCPRCGANLNLETCRCAGAPAGSPFAALQAIKQRLPDKATRS